MFRHGETIGSPRTAQIGLHSGSEKIAEKNSTSDKLETRLWRCLRTVFCGERPLEYAKTTEFRSDRVVTEDPGRF